MRNWIVQLSHLDKAANFKELHIGTTLTQTQYDFSINLLKVELLDKSISQVKFINKGWWYSPSNFYEVASLKLKKIMLEYVVVNQLAYDPDRTRLVYDLFCAESTTSFDEAWYLMKSFSAPYFRDKYEAYQRTDNRPKYSTLLCTCLLQNSNGKMVINVALPQILITH